MPVARWQALGNVYAVAAGSTPLGEHEARRIAKGTDGVVELLAHGDDWAEVRIWNPDGSQAELSGNATRIAAAWVVARSGARAVRVGVGSRVVRTRVLDSGDFEQEMGQVRIGPEEEADGIRFTPVDVGNPHAVVAGDPDDLPAIGPRLETHERFPQRTNVQVARIDRPGHVTARVWERGVGETQASGTSAVAVAAATHGEGEVVVSFPGGDLTVRLRDGQATLVGPAAPID
jgi:diaminopimelate epimerase